MFIQDRQCNVQTYANPSQLLQLKYSLSKTFFFFFFPFILSKSTEIRKNKTVLQLACLPYPQPDCSLLLSDPEPHLGLIRHPLLFGPFKVFPLLTHC